MATLMMPGVCDEQAEQEAAVAEVNIRTAGGHKDRRMVVRRGNQAQGQALEFLGHSIEYLVDSRLFTKDAQEATNDREAVQILMRMSRAVFAECPEVISVKRRLKRLAWKALTAVTGFDRRK